MSLMQRRFAMVTVTLVGLLAMSHPSLQAQTTSAAVSGSVRDTQGAVLPGATVTLTSNTQGNALSTLTDGDGNFMFPNVRPDTYTLKVSITGFQSVERSRLVVNANDKLSAGTITLGVGRLEESVTVLARVSELQTQSGERSFTLENQAIENIAVNGRSFFGLVGLVPGVQPEAGDNRDAAAPTQASNFTANGQRRNSNNFTVDGVSNIDTGDNGGNMATTNLDAVAEFKVLTSSYQAEFGRAAGAQVQLVTKSGTQDFFGSAYWYGRRGDWNANSWLNNRSGTTRPATERNDFGYTLGGPVYFPGKFNTDKKKLFFFFSQEFQRRRDPVGETRVTVPTDLERRGDFSQSVDANGNPYPYIRDPESGLPCSATDTRGCFQDGGVLGRIPPDRLYALGLAILNLYPQPNALGNRGFNYRSQEPNGLPRREELLRLDFHPSDQWRFTGRYLQDSDNRDLPLGQSWAVGANVPTLEGKHDVPGYNWLLSTTGILNSTTSLEISLGSAHNSLDIYTTNDKLTRTGAGLASLPLLFPDAVQDDLIPRFDFTGGRINNPGQFRTDRGPFTNFNTTYDVLANLTKVMGAHSAKAGVYFQRSLKDQSPFASFNGLIDFANNVNNPFDTSHPYANALLGVFNTYTQSSKYAKPKWRYSNLEGYLQDNWKTSRRLTLDYGVRFYYMTPQWDVSNQASNFLPSAFNASRAVRLYTPVCIGNVTPCSGTNRRAMDPALLASQVPTMANTLPDALVGRLVPGSGDRFNGAFQSGQGIDETLSSGSQFRISPRFGFAYDLSGRQSLILRGGFGVFYDRPQGNVVFDMITNPPGVQQQQLTWGRLQDLGSSLQINAPVTMNPTEFDFDLPTVYSWNVGLQTKLPWALTWDVAYVGSESRKLLQQTPINAVPYGAKFQTPNQDPTRAPSTTPGATALPDDLLRPYAGYAGIRLWEFAASSNYHALQTSLNRRFDKGLLLGISYVWSKALGTVNTDFSTARPDGPEANRRANYSYLDIDRPHNLTANLVYQLPKTSKGALGALLNDWQISGIYTWISGTPYAVNFSIPGVGAANLTGSDGSQNARVVVVRRPGKGWSSDPYRQLDTAAFAPPQTGSTGFESARYLVHGPPINNLDLSLSKSFPVGGKRRMEIRLDAFNALNHAQFTGVNNTVNFRSLTDPTVTNLPYDASGTLVNPNGFGTVTNVRLPRQLQVVTRFIF